MTVTDLLVISSEVEEKMACRDLSSRFIQLRTDAKAKSVRRRNISSMSPNEGNSLIRDADVREWEAARHALPPIWVDNVEEVNEVILKIKDKSKNSIVVVLYIDLTRCSGEIAPFTHETFDGSVRRHRDPRRT